MINRLGLLSTKTPKRRTETHTRLTICESCFTVRDKLRTTDGVYAASSFFHHACSSNVQTLNEIFSNLEFKVLSIQRQRRSNYEAPLYSLFLGFLHDITFIYDIMVYDLWLHNGHCVITRSYGLSSVNPARLIDKSG